MPPPAVFYAPASSILSACIRNQQFMALRSEAFNGARIRQEPVFSNLNDGTIAIDLLDRIPLSAPQQHPFITTIATIFNWPRIDTPNSLYVHVLCQSPILLRRPDRVWQPVLILPREQIRIWIQSCLGNSLIIAQCEDLQITWFE